jgi:hypothetical protein
MPRKRAATAEEEKVVDEAEREFEEACRQRAYEISQSEDAGTPEENWIRAEQEQRGSAAGAEE